MFNIIVYGKKRDISISRTLIKCLSKYGGVQYSIPNETGFSGCCTTPSFFLLDLPRMNKFISNQKGCIIFKNSFNNFSASLFQTHLTPIFDVQNTEAYKVLARTNKIVITCGTSAKDTLSLASLKEDSAVISLQRYIKTFNSDVIEPRDFTVKFSDKIDVYPLLSTCAVLLLSGVSPDNGYII